MASDHVLVADSDPKQRQMVDMLLAPDEMEIVSVESGREALQYLRTHTPDLVILGLDLPDMPGDAICGKVKKVSRLASMPVVLVAPAHEPPGLTDEEQRRAEFVDADLVLPRPLGDKNLRERARRLMERARAEASDATTVTDGSGTAVLDEALGTLAGEAPESPAPTAGDAPDHAAPASGGTPTPAPEARGLRAEVETLRLENHQLMRKLREKQEERADEAHPRVKALEQEVGELRRRNELLRKTLEEERRERDQRSGFFGWLKS